VLFYYSFSGAGPREAGALVLSGLGMGTVSGALVQRYFTVSRSRAALIDVGGAVGLIVGIAAESFYSQNTGASGPSAHTDERVANFALGGLATGLITGGVLTRNMDAPNLGNVAPALGKATTAGGGSTTTFGIGGSF
jgi:hypothetical protein